uniref:Uncharacterized protein n=1 Tax=Meloidogyne floridensis TaxID=298350 RepID=A0A915PB07_9BILA
MLFGLLYKTFFGSKTKNGDSSSENLTENVNESVGNVDENSVDMVSKSGSHSDNESVKIVDENSVSVSSSHSSSSRSRSKSRSPSRSPSRSSRSRSSSSDSSMDKNINDKPSNPIISEPSSSNSLQKYGKASYPMKRVRFANQRYSPYNRSVRVHKSGNIINKVPTVRIGFAPPVSGNIVRHVFPFPPPVAVPSPPPPPPILNKENKIVMEENKNVIENNKEDVG